MDEIDYKNFILMDFNNSEYDWYYYKQEETYYFSWAYKDKICDIIIQYDLNDKEIERFQSIADAKRKTGANNISQVLSGKYKFSNNYKFKKIKDQEYIFNSFEKEEMIKKNVSKHKNYELSNDIFITMTNFKITRQIRLHRLIYICKNGEGVHKCCDCNKEFLFYIFNNESNDFHIDHVDDNHNNNVDSNLQLLCPSCHTTKTNLNRNRNNSGQTGATKSITVYKKGDKEFKKEFTKIRDAISELDIKDKRITHSLKTGKYVGSKEHSNKYKFVCNDVMFVNEIFEKHPLLNIEISTHGRIKNSNGINTGGYKEGYMVTDVKNNNIKKTYRIHRLVMETFKNDKLQEKAKEIQKEYPELSIEDIIDSRRKPYSIIVDHIDQNKINNKLENLRWSTYTENSLNTKRSRKIKQWSMKGEFIKEFNSMTECCIELFGKYDNNILKVLSGERKHLKGYIFKYSNEKEPEKILSKKDIQYNLYINIFSSITNFFDINKRKLKRTIYDKEEMGLACKLKNLNNIYINKKGVFKNDDIYSLWTQIRNSDKYKKYFK